MAEQGAQRRVLDIADYALIGDCHTNALVGTNGSIDWLCFPRPDSASVFTHLLDDQHGGNFAVRVDDADVTRSYLDDTNVLCSTWRTDAGELAVTDCMPLRLDGTRQPIPLRGVLRRLECTSGRITAQIRVTPRFEYALVVPRLRTPTPFVADFVGGGSAMRVRATHPLQRRDAHTLRRGDVLAAAWELDEGEVAWLLATWTPAHLAPTDVPDPEPEAWQELLDGTVDFWHRWITECEYEGDRKADVHRSALVLKALTYAPSGALLAAATTSLPEEIGGERNWDYRYTWIRDATLTLTSLFILGLRNEALAFKEWMERTGAGRPQDLQIMYGVEGERMLPEITLDHLGGHHDSSPVRVGNGAVKQLQLDSFGQLLESAYLFGRAGGDITDDNWRYLSGLADLCSDRWTEPDQGIWEIRAEPRHFTHSKVNCWLALKRAVQLAEARGESAPDKWTASRDEIAERLLSDARQRGWFAQSWGADVPDAAALLVPAVGFIGAADPLVAETVRVVTAELAHDGLMHRYKADDGLRGGEGAFLLCSFWLVDVLVHAGQVGEARELLDRLRGMANDVGMFAEEVDPITGRHLGNTPQAFTHMALVTSCAHLSAAERDLLPTDGAPYDFAELALDRLLSRRDNSA
ncbi:MAG TPA: glycoside hydrolase family 15 protein [Mycobacteriales bacterium]|nr:glycoside hydrolase family 15 protein [Mycobacteriales bacterium]